MKMRKKLAALLAAAMVASVMPMTAFAASTNRVTTDVIKVAENKGTTAPDLKIELKDEMTVGDVFYVNLENAEWAKAVGTTSDVAVKFETEIKGKKMMEVKVVQPLGKDDLIQINLDTTKIKGDATVEIDPWGTTVSPGKFVFATSSDSKTTVDVGDAPTFYSVTSKKIAKLTIQESVKGAFDTAEIGDKIEIMLSNDDFRFSESQVSTTVIKGTKGLTTDTGLEFERDSKNFQKATIKVTPAAKTKFSALTQRGAFEVELLVDSTTRKPSEGDLEVNLKGAFVENKDYTVAKIATYGVELKAEKDNYEFLAGRTEDVKFHLNEIVADSMFAGQTTEFTLSEGVYFKPGSIKLGSKTITPNKNDDDQVTGFDVTLDSADIGTLGEFEFEAKLDIPANFEGDVVLTAQGRSVGQDLEVVLAKVAPTVKVTVEPMTVKVGMKNQTGGKVVIEELVKGALNRGENILVQLEKELGVTLTDDADVKVTKGDLKIDDIKTTASAITIPVKRESREASTVEITNINVKLDRTVPEGAYDIEVGGRAISKLSKEKATDTGLYGFDNIVAKDFLFVGERYTRPVAVFTIGSEVFTVNGEAMTMDAAAYIKDGRTMVPLRYLSYALGINPDSIKFNAGIVTIFAEDGKVIQVKNNDNNLIINGMAIPMVAAAEIVEGRTYVPVTEIGGVFGVTGTWDAEAQTATFK